MTGLRLRAVECTSLPEKRFLYMLAELEADPRKQRHLVSTDLYLFNIVAPFRYDWRDMVRRLRARAPDVAIVVVAEAATTAIVDDAMRAGADELLYESEIAFPQLVWQRIGGFLERPAPTPAVVNPVSDNPRLRIVAAKLRAPTGRLDAIKIAKQLGIPIARLAAVAGVSRQALSQTPDSPSIQHALDPIARALHVLDGSLDSDDQRKWLRASHAELEDRTPLDTIMSGNANAVARLLENRRALEE
jgi:hypothetical protein